MYFQKKKKTSIRVRLSVVQQRHLVSNTAKQVQIRCQSDETPQAGQPTVARVIDALSHGEPDFIRGQTHTIKGVMLYFEKKNGHRTWLYLCSFTKRKTRATRQKE